MGRRSRKPVRNAADRARRHGAGDAPRVEVSAAVIAKDEAGHIADLAASLRGVVDEMVLLDTGSVDGTPELAAEHGFRVFHRPWNDHFAQARNAAISHATGRWILAIDADERLVTADPDALRRLVRSARDAIGPNRPDGFWITLDSFTTDDLDEAASERGQQVRLFDRTRLRFEGRVHEWLAPLHARQPVYLQAPHEVRLLHLGYTPAIWNGKGKVARNTALVEAAAAEQSGKDSRDLGRIKFEQARTALARSTAEGLELMLDAVAHMPKEFDGARHATGIAARLLTDLGRDEEALQLLRDTVVTDAFATEFGVIEATALARLGRDAEAAQAIARIEDQPHYNSSNIDLRIRIPALKAELLAISGEPRASWRTLASLSTQPAVSLRGNAAGLARRVWRRAAEADRADDYLVELVEETDGAQFERLADLLPEAHRLAALGAQQLRTGGALEEPDPRLAAFTPKLAAHSVAAIIALAASRLNAEPALALGIAAVIGDRCDARPEERSAAAILRTRALLVLGHVEAAAELATTLGPDDELPDADRPLAGELRWMASDAREAREAQIGAAFALRS